MSESAHDANRSELLWGFISGHEAKSVSLYIGAYCTQNWIREWIWETKGERNTNRFSLFVVRKRWKMRSRRIEMRSLALLSDLQSWKTVEKNFNTIMKHSFRSPRWSSPIFQWKYSRIRTEWKRLVDELIIVPLDLQWVVFVNDFLHSQVAIRSYFKLRYHLLQERIAPNPTIVRRIQEFLQNREEIRIIYWLRG